MSQPSLPLKRISKLLTNSAALRIVLTVLLFVSLAGAQATEKIIKILGSPDANGGLVFDANGNLFGSTRGILRSYGTVYELLPHPNGTWSSKILYSFKGTAADGAYPHGNLILDKVGNVYGAATVGGSHFCPFDNLFTNCGVVFELTPNPTGEWTEKIIYDFQGGTDGANPGSGLISDSAGNLYGTTGFGGDFHGTVYELMPNPDGTWTEKVLYRFTGADGNGPNSLVLDARGNLFGTTVIGGTQNQGTIFELSPQADGTWTFHSLYSFCSRTNCRDGYSPNGLVVGKAGNLYGTANEGGNIPCWTDFNHPPLGCGTAFKLNHLINGTWGFELLHAFCTDTGCPDGSRPSGLTPDGNGDFYAASVFGGANGQGALLKLSHPPVAGLPWSISILYSFCSLPQCADGFQPGSNVTINAVGHLFGVVGVTPEKIFEITPPQ